MKAAKARNIGELRALARRRLPRAVLEYIEGGAEDHVTLRANRAAFDAIRFAPRTLVDVSQRTQALQVLGKQFDCPFGIAPLGASGLCWHEADVALACAANGANVPFALSTHAFLSTETVARRAGVPPWYQLYMPKDRAAAAAAVRRVFDAGCEVLMLTADVPVGGNREYNERSGFSLPLRLGWRQIVDGLAHPRWLAGVYCRSLVGRNLPGWSMRRDRACWQDLDWLRGVWPGKLVVKGILTVEDALLAEQHGADGIVVSNHGGRQLDGAPSPVEVLPAIADAVGERLAVLVDGGFRRGSDIVKALALGARMVFVGRAALYGVAAGGEAGARRALEILRSEVDRVLALLGCNSVTELGRHHLLAAPQAAWWRDTASRSASSAESRASSVSSSRNISVLRPGASASENSSHA